jgi:hypothetical protein
MTMRLTDAGIDVNDLESDGEMFHGVVPSDAQSTAREPEWASDDHYPRLFNLSAAWMYRQLLRADVPDPPEYVTIRFPSTWQPEFSVPVAQWNSLWEAAQFRRRFFDLEELPAPIGAIADRGDLNVIFVPRTRSRYYEYSPLFHLLPAQTIRRFGLPFKRAGQWPFTAEMGDIDRYLPLDFETRLASAWASQVWRHLMPGSPMTGFTDDDPIKLLAHNLDFWIPPVTTVIQELMGEVSLVDNGVVEGPVHLEDGSLLAGASTSNPRKGAEIWHGAGQAKQTLEWVVEEADAAGQLRGILDAVRSNRVEDDFSERWSYAREDFERKLYRKRLKIKTRFVELTDTIPVQGPEAEVVGGTVTAGFLTLLKPREREIVVLLNSGVTNLADVGDLMGCANHSAVSKHLARVRTAAIRHFDAI